MEQNVLITKMIGIIVAVIVAAVVLVPICNSLTDGNGNEGGGEGTGGSYTLVNDLSDYVGTIGITIPSEYNSYQIYTDYDNFNMSMSEDQTTSLSDFKKTAPSENLDMDLNDLRTLAELPISTLNENASIFLFEVLIGATMDSYVVDVTLQYYHDNDDDGIFLDVAKPDTPIETINISDISQFNLTYNVNQNIGHLTIKGTSVDYDTDFNGNNSIIQLISTRDVGILDTGMLNFFEDFVDSSEIYLDSAMPIFGTCQLELMGSGSADYLMEPAEFITANPQIEDGIWNVGNIGFSFDNDSVTASGDISVLLIEGKMSVPSSSGNNNARIDNVVASVGYNTTSITVKPMMVSTVSFTGSSDDSPSSGDSSGNGDLGVAGTIIGIIPVFVILAILMGAAGLFYQNRKTI